MITENLILTESTSPASQAHYLLTVEERTDPPGHYSLKFPKTWIPSFYGMSEKKIAGYQCVHEIICRFLATRKHRKS